MTTDLKHIPKNLHFNNMKMDKESDNLRQLMWHLANTRVWSAQVFQTTPQSDYGDFANEIIGYDTVQYDHYSSPTGRVYTNRWSKGTGPANYPYSNFTVPYAGVYAITSRATAAYDSGTAGFLTCQLNIIEDGVIAARGPTFNTTGFGASDVVTVFNYYEGYFDKGSVIATQFANVSSFVFTPVPLLGRTDMTIAYRGMT